MNFVSTLFDFSFNSFVTEKLVRFLYSASILVVGVGALVYFVRALEDGVLSTLIALVVTPVAFLLAVTLSRIYLELAVVLFRIADHAAAAAGALQAGGHRSSLDG